MTEAQKTLLQRLIDADRFYRTALHRDEPMASNDWRGVEIGAINGVNPRTAEALAEAGLCEIVDMNGRGQACAFLGRYNPYDDPEVSHG